MKNTAKVWKMKSIIGIKLRPDFEAKAGEAISI